MGASMSFVPVLDSNSLVSAAGIIWQLRDISKFSERFLHQPARLRRIVIRKKQATLGWARKTGSTMELDELRALLEQVQCGQVGLESALERLRAPAMADLDYAHVDLHRRDRCGFPEVIFCEGKNHEWVEGVIRELAAAGQDCLATRVSADLAEYLAR